MASEKRSALLLVMLALVVGLAILGWQLLREKPDATPIGAASPPAAPVTEPAPPTAPVLPQSAAAPPAVNDLFDHARLHLRITGVAEPLDLDPPPDAQLDPAPLSPLEAARRVTSACKPGGTEITVDVAPGRWLLQCGTMKPAVVQETVDLATGMTDRSCDATQYSGLEGRVVDERGAALKGVRVLVMPLSSVRGGWPNSAGLSDGTTITGDGQLVARTRADGSYTLPFLPADTFYVLEASAPNRLVVRRDPFGLESARLQRLPAIVLAAGRAISGHVVSEAGTPVKGCDIFGIAPEPRRALRTTTDAGGRFRFENLSNGPVSVWTNTRLGLNVGEEVTAPGDVELTFVLRDGAWIEGTASHEDGSPAAGLSLDGYPRRGPDALSVGESHAGSQSATTGKDGSFRLGPFSPGPVRVTEDVGSFLEQEVVAPAVVHLVVPGQQAWDVVLRFLDEAGQPVAKSATMTVACSRGEMASSMSGFGITPDGKGEWGFRRSTPAGVSVRLSFSFPDCQPAVVPDLAAAQAAGQPVDVLVRREQVFRVRVVDAAGQVVRGAHVRLFWKTDNDGMRASIMQPRPDVMQSGLQPFPGQPALTQAADSDDVGIALFHRLTDGPVAWMVSAAGEIPASGQQARLDPPIADGADLQIVLRPTLPGAR